MNTELDKLEPKGDRKENVIVLGLRKWMEEHSCTLEEARQQSIQRCIDDKGDEIVPLIETAYNRLKAQGLE